MKIGIFGAACPAAIAVLLLMTGCGQKTDLALRFETEKMLVKADRLSEQLRLKGASLSDQDLQTLVNAYSAVAVRIPPPRDAAEVERASQERKQAWSLALLASMRTGNLYLSKRTYQKAFDCFKRVADNPASDLAQRADALGNMAFSLERMKNYTEAAALYDSLAVGYQLIIVPNKPNMSALGAPLKAAEMWLRAGDRARFEARMHDARGYYNEIIRRYPGTAVESAAIGKLVASYLQQKQFVEAVDLLKTVRDDSTGQATPTMMLTIADIYMKNMEDYRNAESTYRDFLRYYPDHKELGQARLGLALSLHRQGRFAEARKAVDGIERVKNVTQDVVAQANYLAALCYEAEGKWELAKGQFDLVQASFPGTDQAFEAALYVPARYRTEGKDNLAKRAFADAVKYVNNYIEDNSARPASVSRALGYLVRAYTENGNVAAAIEKLTLLHQRYVRFPEGRFAPLKLADFYENVLHDTSKTISWLQTFVEDNPDAENLDDVKGQIQLLEARVGRK